MTKTQLVARIALATGQNAESVKRVLAALASVTAHAVSSGESKIPLPGIGKLRARSLPAGILGHKVVRLETSTIFAEKAGLAVTK